MWWPDHELETQAAWDPDLALQLYWSLSFPMYKMGEATGCSQCAESTGTAGSRLSGWPTVTQQRRQLWHSDQVQS